MGRGGKGGGAKRREEQASRRVRGGLCGTEGLVRGWEGGWVRLLERRALRGSAGCSRRRRALLVELRHVSWGKWCESRAREARGRVAVLWVKIWMMSVGYGVGLPVQYVTTL